MFNSTSLNILHPPNDLYHCSFSHTTPYATNTGYKISGRYLGIGVLPQSNQEPTPAVGWSLKGWRKMSNAGCGKEWKGSLSIICQIWQVSGIKQRAHTNRSLHVCFGGQRPRKQPRDACRRGPRLPSPGPCGDAASWKRSSAAPVPVSWIAVGCGSWCNRRKQHIFHG